jgi:hypothetical protein
VTQRPYTEHRDAPTSGEGTRSAGWWQRVRIRRPREQSMTSAGAVRTVTALTVLTVVVALVLITT